MKLSLVISIEQALLTECLDSIRMQTVTDYEVLVLIEACNQAHIDLCKHYASLMPQHVSLMTRSTQCLEHTAIQQAKGTYILFMKGTDIFSHPNALKEVFYAIEKEPDVIILPISACDDHGKLLWKQNLSNVEPQATIGGTYHQMLNQALLCPRVYCSCCKRSILIKHHLSYYPGVRLKALYFMLVCCKFFHTYEMIQGSIYQPLRYPLIRPSKDHCLSDILFLIEIFIKEQSDMEYDMKCFMEAYLMNLFEIAVLIYSDQKDPSRYQWKKLCDCESLFHKEDRHLPISLKFVHCVKKFRASDQKKIIDRITMLQS